MKCDLNLDAITARDTVKYIPPIWRHSMGILVKFYICPSVSEVILEGMVSASIYLTTLKTQHTTNQGQAFWGWLWNLLPGIKCLVWQSITKNYFAMCLLTDSVTGI